jgi:hypothetical protein
VLEAKKGWKKPKIGDKDDYLMLMDVPGSLAIHAIFKARGGDSPIKSILLRRIYFVISIPARRLARIGPTGTLRRKS